MQTFVPFPSFERSAAALDDRRLGKQRVEVLQILRALTRESYGWKRHPAVLMWQEHEEALAAYGFTVCEEWTRRGFSDTCAATIACDLRAAGIEKVRTERQLARARHGMPPWWGDERVHASHQSSLVRKDAGHYGPRFPGVDPDLAYYWPVRH